jgi:hypothetical protein
MKKEIIIRCDYNEIEDLLELHYGITHYEILAAEECSNGTNLDYDIDGKDYDKDDVAEVLAGQFKLRCTGDLMNQLCADGHIEAGTYIVSCSW